MEKAFIFGMMNATTPAYNLIKAVNSAKLVIPALANYFRG